jgi:hypothetical protein
MVQSLEFRVLGFAVDSLGFRVQGLMSGVQDSGFMAQS